MLVVQVDPAKSGLENLFDLIDRSSESPLDRARYEIVNMTEFVEDGKLQNTKAVLRATLINPLYSGEENIQWRRIPLGEMDTVGIDVVADTPEEILTGTIARLRLIPEDIVSITAESIPGYGWTIREVTLTAKPGSYCFKDEKTFFIRVLRRIPLDVVLSVDSESGFEYSGLLLDENGATLFDGAGFALAD